MDANQEAPRVDRRRHGRAAADERERATVERPQHAPTAERAILDLQRAAGNRGVAALLGGGVVQRRPEPSATNDGGALKLGSGEEIPIQSATWSMKVAVAISEAGAGRTGRVHAAGMDIGELTITRLRDKASERAMELLGTEHKAGTIRLVRPSRDGALPATNLDLSDVTVSSYATGKSTTSDEGDGGNERIELGVGWMKIAGMGKDEVPNPKPGKGAMAPTHWQLKVGAGGPEPWPAIPLISAKFGLMQSQLSSADRGRPASAERIPGPYRATVLMSAGMGLTRLAKTPAQGIRLDVAFAESGSDRFEMADAIVEKISSTSDGPDVVEVSFVSDAGGFTKAAGGAKTGGQAGASTR